MADLTGAGMHIFVSGAGPVGLSAAIALAARGHEVTIADRDAGVTEEARAVGVSRNSLSLLSHCGATAQIMARAEVVRTARIVRDGETLTRLKIPGQDRRRPSIVALPQSATERILHDVLTRYGVSVLWQHETTGLAQSADAVEVELTHRETGVTRTVRADYAFGADGSHSAVRRLLNIDFPGRTLDDTWSVADAECEFPWPDQVCAVMSDTGAVAVIITIGEGRHRLISNRPDVVEIARGLMPVRNVLRESTFHVDLRAAEVMGVGRVCLGGDAAHVHSPVGGRGMNLGIADAFAFAEAVDDGDLALYRSARLASAKRTLRWTNRAFRALTPTGSAAVTARDVALRTAGAVSRLIA